MKWQIQQAMPKSKFKISPFTNPSGITAWRLSGTLNGKRIRQNFKTRPEAVAQRQEYDVEHLNGETEGRTVWTTLTPEENRDAVAAINSLKSRGSKCSLAFAVDYLLQHYRPPDLERQAAEVAQEYLDKRDRDCLKGFITELQYKTIKNEMQWFQRCFEGRLISSVTSDDYRDYIEKPKNQLNNRRKPPKVLSAKTWNNRRGTLNTFCVFCLEQKYLAENPIARLPKHKHRSHRGTAETLKAETAVALMQYLEGYSGLTESKRSHRQKPGFLVPFFALTLFAGIRPDWKSGEISKIEPRDIDLTTGVIRVEPEASKVNEKRTIKIQPNLKLWLEKYPIDEFPPIPRGNIDRLLREVRTRFSIGHDVLRHTYISMTVGAFRSVGDASLQAGNSESVIRKHYLDLKSTEEADKFWQIVPTGSKFPEMEKKDGRFVPKKKAAS